MAWCERSRFRTCQPCCDVSFHFSPPAPSSWQSATRVRKRGRGSRSSNIRKLGPYLTAGGTSVYLFEEDRPEGERGRSVESDCLDRCLERWPPVTGDPVPDAGEGVDASLVGSFRRPDGKVQAMYNGWPLYYFADDYVAGDVNGHDFEEFGGEWYLMTPDGQEVPGSLR